MQTVAPPDEVLKERFARIDERFDEVNRRITEGREETKDRFNRVERDLAELKKGDIAELRKGVASVQASVESVQSTLTRISIGLAITFASALASVLVKVV